MANKTIADFLAGKPAHTVELYHHFIATFKTIGVIEVSAAKTMIGISNTHKRIAWVTHLGKNFIHVVFPFKEPHADNLCFTKIAPVPGTLQFNHHLRMLYTDDVNDEILYYMKLAYDEAG
jgi:Domain of unknown function (DUF5655)